MSLFSRVFTATLLLAATLCPVSAQGPFDGLTMLGVGHDATDQQGDQLRLMAFKTKHGEPVVGFYCSSGNTQVHYYVNAAAWDKLKQLFIRARDQWPTLTQAEFTAMGAAPGYRIANRLATIRISLEGPTPLASSGLLLIFVGGASQVNRVVIDLKRSELKNFVEDLYKIDSLMRGDTPVPTP